ncbi:MAG: hypothetical protein HYR49_11200 [Gammaproteobacteria bacterium]|nr:hypothetical protein [Gammaproteobacteria bacterium]
MRILVLTLLLTVAVPVVAEHFSSMATFTMVANCMDENGGQTAANLYTCSCRADIIRAGMSAEDYEDAMTVERYRELPADKGAVFRDSRKGQQLYDSLKKIRRQAADSCPVIRTVAPLPKPEPAS